MSELVAFLLARIAEDEDAARTPPPHYAPFEREWEWCPKARTGPLGDLPGPDAPCECGADSWTPEPRALAECEAKRAIVDWAAPAATSELVPTDRPGVYDRRPVRYVSDDGADLLRILAAVYADHPDYQEAWKP